MTEWMNNLLAALHTAGIEEIKDEFNPEKLPGFRFKELGTAVRITDSENRDHYLYEGEEFEGLIKQVTGG